MDRDSIAFLPESLVLSVEEIDRQHGALFSLLADIKAACLRSNALPPELAAGLIDFLHEHFRTEERLAALAGYNFAVHDRKHLEMVSAIEKGLSEVVTEAQDVFSVLRYVEYWFERHIAEEDRPLGAFLRRTVR